MFEDYTVSFIGSGVMGEAMIKGLLRGKVVEPGQVLASDVRPERCKELAQQYGIRTTTDNAQAAHEADLLVLSVKPQVLDHVLPELRAGAPSSSLVLSIVAGMPIQAIINGLGNACVVRAMPNTPGQIGQGITVWTATPEVTAAQQAQARAVLGALGEELFVDNEDYLDMATALSGTGPAYVFLFMEAMIDAGVHMGFSRRMAEQLVYQTVRGSVEFAMSSEDHPAVLRNQVTSPGGTSAEAIYQLEKGGLRTVLARAVWAAYRRSVALGTGKKVSSRLSGRDPEDLGEGR